MTIAPSLGHLAQIGLHKTCVRMGNVDAEIVDLDPPAGQQSLGLAKIRLRMPRSVAQGNKHFLRQTLLAAHILMHNGQPARVAMFIAQPLKHPLRGMPLLGTHGAVTLDHRVNMLSESSQLDRYTRRLAPISRRNRVRQHLRDRVAVNTK